MAALYEEVCCELLLTSSCNMRCTYCIAREVPRGRMTREIGRRAVDLFLSLAEGAKSVEFVFTGGEPLLEFALLQDLTGYARRRTRRAGMEASFVLKTNGLLLTREMLRFLKRSRISVALSIDGRAGVHNRCRKNGGRRGTHAAVEKHLRALLDQGVPCVASMTVHPRTCRAVPEGVRYLHELGANQIDVGPAYGTVTWSEADCDELERAFEGVADYLREVNSEGTRLEVGPLFERSEHVGGQLAECWGCRSASSNLAFLPNGQVAGCSALGMIAAEFPELILGDVWNGLDAAALARLLRAARRGVEERPGCQGCPTAPDCTGGCLAINYAQNRAAGNPPEFYCRTIAAIPKAWTRAWPKSRAAT